MYIKSLGIIPLILSVLFFTACSKEVKEVNELKEVEENIELVNDLREIDCGNIEKSYGIDFVLVLDSSGSMEKNDPEDLRIKDSKLIVEKMKDDDRALVISFDNEARLMMNGFSNDKDEIISALDKVASDKKYTNLGAALDMSINEFENDIIDRQKVIIALTDGENAGENEDLTEQMNINSYKQALNASNQNISIYTIGLGQDLDEGLLRSIAETTGGKYFNAENSFKLDEVYREVVKEIDCLPLLNDKEDGEKYILFEDESFKQLINITLNKPDDYAPTQSDFQRITEISSADIDKNSIYSIKGIEYASNLQVLDLDNQEIEELYPLYHLYKLESLKINGESGILSILSESEKKNYANYIVDLENEFANTQFLSGKILDVDHDNKLDVVAVFKKQCTSVNFKSDCIFIQVLTIEKGKVKVVHDTEEYSENPQTYLLEELGETALNAFEVHIKSIEGNLEVVIYMPSTDYRMTVEYYQYYNMNNMSELSHSESVKTMYECRPADSECNKNNPTGEDINSLMIKGNMSIESILATIDSSDIKITSENSRNELEQLYEFATTKVNSNSISFIKSPEIRTLMSNNGFLKSNINEDDSYSVAIDKSFEQLEYEGYFAGSHCTSYETFSICGDVISPHDSDIDAVILIPEEELTVSDVENALVHQLDISFISEGPNYGDYISVYESNGQYYQFTSESDGLDSLIYSIFIKNSEM